MIVAASLSAVRFAVSIPLMNRKATNTDTARRPWCEVENPLICGWISDDLLLETQEVWSKAYGRPISRDEAIDILENVKQLASALSEIPPVPREDGPTQPLPEEQLPQDLISVMYRYLLKMGHVKMPERPQEPKPTPCDYQI